MNTNPDQTFLGRGPALAGSRWWLRAGLHLLAAILIVLAPTFVADHSVSLLSHVDYQIIALGFACSYLVCASILELRTRRQGLGRLYDAVVYAAACVAPAALFVALSARSDAARSPGDFARRDLIVAVGLVFVLAIVLTRPKLPRKLAFAGLLASVLFAAVGVYTQYTGILPGSNAHEERQKRILRKRVDAPFYTLQVTRYRNYITEPFATGGGLARYGAQTLLATGDGDLYLLDSKPGNAGAKPGKNDLQIRKLALHIPLDRHELMAHRTPAIEITTFRVTDVLVHTEQGHATLYAAYHVWNQARQCFAIRVASLEGAAGNLLESGAQAQWKPLYETTPCLKPADVHRKPYTGFMESGGRLALLDEHRLLLTTGDCGFDGLHSATSVAQEANDSYGKTILIDLASGTASQYTSGHRDPQGLWVDSDGSVWSTEHGPQGGDELNRILAGRNYGWPNVSLGTEYGWKSWPLSHHQGFHEGYEQPLFAWVPAIGISNLIRLAGTAFPLWGSDLLIGSLRDSALWRIRMDGEHVQFASQIPLGSPIRDLEEDASGRILVWTDHEILTLEPASGVAEGEQATAVCMTCHTLYPDKREHGIGPNLTGVVDRKVGTAPDFEYSAALAQLGGSWTRERLEMFLRDPASYVPGNEMHFPGIADAAQRAQIIEYLKSRD